jgi:hypothetical protein
MDFFLPTTWQSARYIVDDLAELLLIGQLDNRDNTRKQPLI